MSQSIEDLMNLAEETEDQSVVEGGDFTYEVPVEGKTVGRLIEYIELGMQPQKPYQGKAKPPAEVVRLLFELLSPAKNIKEIEVDGQKRTIAEYISVTITKKMGEKASFQKLRSKMIYGRPFNHLAKCLGDAFILDIVHHKQEAKDGKPARTFANIKKDGEWLISAPYMVDPIAGTTTPINVPENIKPKKIFLWNNPTKETWDSLHIDGTREVKNGDKVEHVSKNWLQETILSATDFNGSKLQLLLGGVASTDLPMKEPEKAVTATLGTAGALPDLGLDKPMPTKPAANADALAALGLTG